MIINAEENGQTRVGGLVEHRLRTLTEKGILRKQTIERSTGHGEDLVERVIRIDLENGHRFIL